MTGGWWTDWFFVFHPLHNTQRTNRRLFFWNNRHRVLPLQMCTQHTLDTQHSFRFSSLGGTQNFRRLLHTFFSSEDEERRVGMPFNSDHHQSKGELPPGTTDDKKSEGDLEWGW